MLVIYIAHIFYTALECNLNIFYNTFCTANKLFHLISILILAHTGTRKRAKLLNQKLMWKRRVFIKIRMFLEKINKLNQCLAPIESKYSWISGVETT